MYYVCTKVYYSIPIWFDVLIDHEWASHDQMGEEEQSDRQQQQY